MATTADDDVQFASSCQPVEEAEASHGNDGHLYKIPYGEIGKNRVDTGVKNPGAAGYLSSEDEPNNPPRRISITQPFPSNAEVSPSISSLNLIPSGNVVEFPGDSTTTENGLVHETSAAKSEPSSTTCPADVDVASASSIASLDSHQNLTVDEKSIIPETTLFRSARKGNPVTSTTDTGEPSADDSDGSSEDDASKKSLTKFPMSEETCDQYHDLSPGQFYLSPPSPVTLRNEAVFFYGRWHGPGPGDPVFDPGAYECSGMVSAHGTPLTPEERNGMVMTVDDTSFVNIGGCEGGMYLWRWIEEAATGVEMKRLCVALIQMKLNDSEGFGFELEGIEQIKVNGDGVVCIPEDVVVCGQTGLTFVHLVAHHLVGSFLNLARSQAPPTHRLSCNLMQNFVSAFRLGCLDLQDFLLHLGVVRYRQPNLKCE